MVSPVDPAQIAARLAALLQRGSEPGSSRPKARSGTAVSSPAGAAPSLAQMLQARLAGIDKHHPDRERARIRTLVRGLLSSEFDHALVPAPALDRLVDEVADALQQTPSLQRDLDRVLSWLDRAPLP